MTMMTIPLKRGRCAINNISNDATMIHSLSSSVRYHTRRNKSNVFLRCGYLLLYLGGLSTSNVDGQVQAQHDFTNEKQTMDQQLVNNKEKQHRQMSDLFNNRPQSDTQRDSTMGCRCEYPGERAYNTDEDNGRYLRTISENNDFIVVDNMYVMPLSHEACRDVHFICPGENFVGLEWTFACPIIATETATTSRGTERRTTKQLRGPIIPKEDSSKTNKNKRSLTRDSLAITDRHDNSILDVKDEPLLHHRRPHSGGSVVEPEGAFSGYDETKSQLVVASEGDNTEPLTLQTMEIFVELPEDHPSCLVESDEAVSTIIESPPSPPESCTEITINFDRAANKKHLQGGEFIQYEWLTPYGITVSAESHSGVKFRPRIFDTQDLEENQLNRIDLDPTQLGSPNRECTADGEGKGSGGYPGQEGANCHPLGKVLIADRINSAEAATRVLSDYGILSFEFQYKVEMVYNIGLLNIAGNRNYIDVFQGDGERTKIPIRSVGINGFQSVPILRGDVEKIVIDFASFSAVTSIGLCIWVPP